MLRKVYFWKFQVKPRHKARFEALWEASQEIKSQAPLDTPPSSLESQEMKIWLRLGKSKSHKAKPEG